MCADYGVLQERVQWSPHRSIRAGFTHRARGSPEFDCDCSPNDTRLRGRVAGRTVLKFEERVSFERGHGVTAPVVVAELDFEDVGRKGFDNGTDHATGKILGRNVLKKRNDRRGF